MSSSTAVQDAKVRAWSCTSAQLDPSGAAEAAGAQQQLTTVQAVTSEAESHCSAVHTLEASRDFIFSAGGDAMIKVWQAGTLQLVRWAATYCISGAVSVGLVVVQPLWLCPPHVLTSALQVIGESQASPWGRCPASLSKMHRF